MPRVSVRNLKKSYPDPAGHPIPVLDIPSFELAEGEQAALRGSSGSGKTTFLDILAGIQVPEEGVVFVEGRDVARLGEGERDRHRARHVGYIFQRFNLLTGHTVLENVLLGTAFGAGLNPSRASSLLDRVGLGDLTGRFPAQLSTGQRQRVAIARAMANQPRLVLADEPTSHLDEETGAECLDLIRDLCREVEASLLLVSHDPRTLDSFPICHEIRNPGRAGAIA